MLNAASANTNVRIFFANLQGICTFFSNSPQRTAVLDETVKKRLPRSASTRWNFNSRVVCTVFEHREDIIETMRKILNQSKNASTINQASGHLKILSSNSFVCWLNLFYKIMPHVDIHSPAEKAEHHYYLKIYRRGMWLLFFNQSLETF
jgi:hypothetical protein